MPALAPAPEREIARTAAFEFGEMPFNHSSNPSVTSPGTSDAGPTLLGEPGLSSSPDLDAAGATAHDVAAMGSPSPLARAPASLGALTAEQSPVSAQSDLSASEIRLLATAATAATATPASPTATALLTALPKPGQLTSAAPAPAPAPEPAAPRAAAPVPAPAPAQVVQVAPAKAAPAPVASAPIPLSPVAAAGPAKIEPAKAEPAKAEPAKAEPAKASLAKAEPAKAEPAKANLAKAAPKAQADVVLGEAPPPKAGGFRETAWFMDALAAENLSEIEEKDISERAAKFDDANDIDEAKGRQFSLRSGIGPRLDPSQVEAARAKAKGAPSASGSDDTGTGADLDAVPASGSPMLYILLALVVLGGLGATAWYLFFRG